MPAGIKYFSLWLTVCASGMARAPEAVAANLLSNGGFEERDSALDRRPAAWNVLPEQAEPLDFSPEHYEGSRSAAVVGDGKTHMWRQEVVHPKQRAWTLRAFVKPVDAVFSKGDYVHVYCHVLYRDQPYETATHFHATAPPDASDWTAIRVDGVARDSLPIDRIQVSVVGKFQRGLILVDDVRLEPLDTRVSAAAHLQNKIDDLSSQLQRVGNLDGSVKSALNELSKAEEKLRENPPAIEPATAHWQSAARAVSHEAWAAIYPDAMSDRGVEAQMIYHGLGPDKATCDRYLDTLELAGANGVYLSFGSWMGVIYHSDLLPVEPGWEEFDALTYFIDEAHRRGLKVFGYLACFYGTHSVEELPGSIAIEHPEWLAKGPDKNMPTFPDPANPEVVAFITRVYEELATRYDLDGIGLDYIRYPTDISLNYDENNRAQILKLTGVDILKQENLPANLDVWPQVQRYRAEKVGHVVRGVTNAVRKAKPGIGVMACLISEREVARDDYGQNWGVSSQWIDYASPMNYDDRPLNESMLHDQRQTFAKTGAVYVPAVGGMPQVHETWTISDWARRVAATRKHDPGGIIIYRIADLDPAVAAFFGKGPFHAPATFPPLRR